MQLSQDHPWTEFSSNQKTSQPSLPRCPACSAPLIEQRDSWRCSRCFLTLCLGCSAEVEHVSLSGSD